MTTTTTKNGKAAPLGDAAGERIDAPDTMPRTSEKQPMNEVFIVFESAKHPWKLSHVVIEVAPETYQRFPAMYKTLDSAMGFISRESKRHPGTEFHVVAGLLP